MRQKEHPKTKYNCTTLDFDEPIVSYPAVFYTKPISNMPYDSVKTFIHGIATMVYLSMIGVSALHDLHISSHLVRVNYHLKVVHGKLDYGAGLVTVLPT